jgi:hypothetical protein
MLSPSWLFNKNHYNGQFSSHKRSEYKNIAEKRKLLKKKKTDIKSKQISTNKHKYNKSQGQVSWKANKVADKGISKRKSSKFSCKKTYSNYSVYLSKDKNEESKDNMMLQRLYTEQDHIKHKKLSLNHASGDIRDSSNEFDLLINDEDDQF